MDIQVIDHYLEANLEKSLAELKDLVAQPSVSAQNFGIRECADLVAGMLSRRGFSTQILSTGGAPIVFAEKEGESDRTLLFYNHYDVQPAEPLELWESPPFEPEIRDGKMYGRGVNDDKGHITSRLFAIDALQDHLGNLPCRIKFVIEGEEEISSLHIEEFVRTHRELLSADACVWEFGGVEHDDVPMQYLGLRGILYVELSVETANQDVHSGLGGSIFPNAAWRLIWALNTLKDPDERIRLPGFYDAIQAPSEHDLELLSQLPEIAVEYQTRYGIQEFLHGLEGGIELQKAAVFEPTCTICGLTSGYQGPGSKTVVPAQASAKIDFRLVPDQKPADVLKSLRTHLDAEGFEDIIITDLGSDAPARTNPDDPFVKIVIDAAADVYEHPMQIVPMVGGSGPNSVFIETLDIPIVTSGIGHPGGQAHAPNENIRLDLYLKGARHIARILADFGMQK